MSTNLFAVEEDQPHAHSSHRSSQRRHKDSAAKIQEEIISFQQDETKMAREIILLRKELSRLHYKVKAYQNNNRTMAIVFNTIIIALLVVIVFKLYAAS